MFAPVGSVTRSVSEGERFTKHRRTDLSMRQFSLMLQVTETTYFAAGLSESSFICTIISVATNNAIAPPRSSKP